MYSISVGKCSLLWFTATRSEYTPHPPFLSAWSPNDVYILIYSNKSYFLEIHVVYLGNALYGRIKVWYVCINKRIKLKRPPFV